MTGKWADGTEWSKDEVRAIEELRKSGCKCELPLLGARPAFPDQHFPRCRLCNTMGIIALPGKWWI